MNRDEEAECREILIAINDAELEFSRFSEWVDRRQFPNLGPAKHAWWYFRTPHGKLGYAQEVLVQGLKSVIPFCWYIPSSTNKPAVVVDRGRSASGVSLTVADLERLFSRAAIESRVRYVLCHGS